jgi:peptide/nickel transport system substrate-binding protein
VVVIALAVGAYWFINRSLPSQEETKPTKADIELLRYGVSEGPLNSFYPAANPSLIEIHLNSQIFEGLVGYNNKKLTPLLATSWINPDNSTWVFTLKPNVKFHTGRVMTAQDVKYSLDSFKDAPFFQQYGGAVIKEVTVVSDQQVKIVTDGPDPLLLNRLVFLFIVDRQGTPNSDANGTGPYMLAPGSSPAENKITLTAFNDYHQGHVYTRGLEISVIEDGAKMAEQLKSHQLSLGPVDAAAVELAGPDFEELKYDDTAIWFLGVNHLKARSPVQKLKVRQAIYKAIDVAALIKALGQTGKPAGQIVTAEIPGFNPDIVRPALDREGAKALLREAGYPRGLSLTLTHFRTAEAGPKEVARQLAEVGITIKLDPISTPDAIAAKVGGGKSELWWQAYASDLLDASDVIGALFGPASQNYRDATVASSLATANQTLDPAKRLTSLQDLSLRLMDNQAWIPLYSQTISYLVDRSYILPLDIPASYLGVYFWKVYQQP